MNLVVSSRMGCGIAAALVCLASLAVPAHAQASFSLGGGWNYLASPPSPDSYTRGFNVRASISHPVVPHLRLRFDGTAMQFERRVHLNIPAVATIACVNPGGCPDPPATYHVVSNVVGLTANAVVDVDPRGILYVMGGAGVYHVQEFTTTLRGGVSAGGGISLPIDGRLRAFAEVNWNRLPGNPVGPDWLTPVTVGLRF